MNRGQFCWVLGAGCSVLGSAGVGCWVLLACW